MIQFMPSTAVNLLQGLTDENGIVELESFVSDEEARQMRLSPSERRRLGAQRYMASLPRSEQMKLVKQYLLDAVEQAGWDPKNVTAGDLYALILMGPAGAKGVGWDPNSEVARNNPKVSKGALRFSKNGRVTGKAVADWFNATMVPKQVKSKAEASGGNIEVFADPDYAVATGTDEDDDDN